MQDQRQERSAKEGFDDPLAGPHRAPQTFAWTNGPEPLATELGHPARASGNRTSLHPRSEPDQSTFFERINRSFREKVLNAYGFAGLDVARRISREWLRPYQKQLPHAAVVSLPPARFKSLIESENICF